MPFALHSFDYAYSFQASPAEKAERLMRQQNADTILAVVYGQQQTPDDELRRALEDYVNGVPLPSALNARCLQLLFAHKPAV